MNKEIEFLGKCLLVEEEGKKILVIGDLHLGYEEALNKTGVYVTRKMYEEMIFELKSVFDKTGKVDKIVLMGDVKHGFGHAGNQEWDEVLKLFAFLKENCSEVIAIKGNHDNYLANIAGRLEIKVVEYVILGKYAFVHGDKELVEIHSSEIDCWIMGHGHPAVRLNDGIKSEMYKCFLVGKFKGKKIVIVPSFFDINLGTDAREFDLGLVWKFDLLKFDVFVVSEDLKVLEFGKLGKIK